MATSEHPSGGGGRSLLVPALALVALGALVLGPVLLHRGFVLVGDMTFVPRQPWKAAWLALDGSVPRAVPADAVVSVLTRVVPGDLLQKAVLWGTLVVAGLGMLRLVSRLLPAASRVAAFGAALLFVWNPFVHQRLGIGQWGLLVGYAALPWVLLAARRFRAGDARAAAWLLLLLAAAAVGSPTGGVVAGVVAVVVVVGRGRVRRTGLVLAATLVVNLPWLVPGVLATSIGTDPAGVRAFAARADTPLGLVGSLATLGAIWKQSIVAPERDTWLLVLIALVISAGGLALLVLRARASAGAREPDGLTPDLARRLLVLAALGFLLALLPATGPGADAVSWLVENVPGAGLLRDSQKWVQLLALVVAVGFGLLIDLLVRTLQQRDLGARWFGLAVALMPVFLLPSLAWGLAGKYAPVAYPGEWDRVADVLGAQPADQRRTVVLPFSTYQRFAWNDNRAALDPAIRYFAGQVVTNDTLVLGSGRVVTGDSEAAARIARAVAAGRPLGPVLAGAGVRYVLVEKTAPSAFPVRVPPGTTLYDGRELSLVDLGNPARLDRSDHPGLVIAADVLAALAVLAAGTFLGTRRFLRKPDVIG
ncbi:hypothetical protein [Marmoricola sp. RAF53]|uniref:hypothetical protein n=1 Tax=Marmoricola sp. RAF53 TaxID=3233059 RepID=UPI003F9449F9